MKELLSGIIDSATGIISKVVPDKDEAARLEHEISTMADLYAQELAADQIEDTSRYCSGCDYDGCLCRLTGAWEIGSSYQ